MNNKSTNEFDQDQWEALSHDLAKIKSSVADLKHIFSTKTNEVYTHLCEQIKDTSMDSKEIINQYVRNKPLQAIGISLVMGITLGWLLKNKR